MFDLLYTVKKYKGELLKDPELLTIVVLKDKAHHFNFLQSFTNWNAVGVLER